MSMAINASRIRLFFKFNEYYENKHDYKEATALIEKLCKMYNVKPLFPRYHHRYNNNITAWYRDVHWWLIDHDILP